MAVKANGDKQTKMDVQAAARQGRIAKKKAEAAAKLEEMRRRSEEKATEKTAKEAAEKATKEATEAAAKEAANPYIEEYTVVSGDSLSVIAGKYYDSAARDKWMAIYEANKEIIGDNPSLIRVGQVLKIPKLPAE